MNNEFKTLRLYKGRQYEIRKRLIQIIKDNPLPFVELSEKIGISRGTLTSFIIDSNEISLKPFIKVTNYIEREEQEKDANENQL